jgi:hypothetical protein
MCWLSVVGVAVVRGTVAAAVAVESFLRHCLYHRGIILFE